MLASRIALALFALAFGAVHGAAVHGTRTVRGACVRLCVCGFDRKWIGRFLRLPLNILQTVSLMEVWRLVSLTVNN